MTKNYSLGYTKSIRKLFSKTAWFPKAQIADSCLTRCILKENLNKIFQKVSRSLRCCRRRNRELNISCQNPLRLSSWERGRYDVQITTFRRIRNATFIPEIERSKMSWFTVINTATPRPIPQQRRLQQLQNGREPCILCKKRTLFWNEPSLIQRFSRTFSRAF